MDEAFYGPAADFLPVPHLIPGPLETIINLHDSWGYDTVSTKASPLQPWIEGGEAMDADVSYQREMYGNELMNAGMGAE